MADLSLKSVNSVWLKTKFASEERYFSTNLWGIWTPRGEGIWTSQSLKTQMPGGLPGGEGCWSFNLTGFCTCTSLLKSLRKCHQEHFKYGGLRSNVVNIKQGKNIWIYQSLSLRSYNLNLSLPWAIKYGGQTWLDEACLMAENIPTDR